MGFYEKILRKKKSIPGNKVKKSDMPAPANEISDKAGTAANSDASIWSNKGNSLVEKNMYSEAVQCYDKALDINPKLVDVWNNKGLALARTGRYAEAAKCYDKALEITPGDAEVMYNKGIALSHLGNHEEAIRCYDKLIEINPSDSGAWCSRGDVLFESGNHEEALGAYDKSIEINSRDETAWNNRGLTLVKLNRFTEAVESYDKALEINPKIEKIWSNKGLALARMREKGDKVDLQKIATSMPVLENGVPVSGNQSHALDSGNQGLKAQPSAGSVEPARESVDATIDIDKAVSGQVMEVPGPAAEEKHPFAADTPADHPESGAEIVGKVESGSESIAEAANMGKNAPIPIAEEMAPPLVEMPPPKAETAVETAILDREQVAKPENVDTTVQLPALGKDPFPIKTPLPATEIGNQAAKEVPTIGSAGKGREPDLGANEMQKGVRRSGKNPQQVKKKPSARDISHKHKKVSEAIVDKPASISSGEVEQSMESVVSGNELFSMGKYEEAIKSFNKSLQVDPGNITAWNNKGMALAKSGRFEEAMQCYEKALEIDPDDYVVLNNKGSALYKNGCIKEAMDCYKSALDLNMKSETAIRGMEICLKHLKNYKN